MARFHKLSVVWVALIGALALALVSGLFGAGQQPGAVNTALLSAQERWAAHPVANYRLLVSETTRGGNTCTQALQVQNETVRTILQNNCKRPATWTVTRLFEWIRQLENPNSNCYPSLKVCLCRAAVKTHAIYDSQSGYPQAVFYQWLLQPNWAHPDYWRYIWSERNRPNCAPGSQTGGTMTLTISLIPTH